MEQKRDEAGTVHLGDVLKSGRLRKGLTLKELAEDPEVGVSATFLSRVERNDALPSDELVLRLARKLGIDESVAIMHLFRERASPEVRAFVPLPSALKLPPGSLPGARFEGLEAIAEPMGRILDLHRDTLAENVRLRAENNHLADEVQALSRENAESKRGFLPDVNRFLCSLFHYESDLVRRETVVSRSGDAIVTVTLEGIRPKKGAPPLHTLGHQTFIPQANDGSVNIDGSATSFEFLERPAGIPVEQTFRRESPERGAFVVSFPEGFAWRSPADRLSYRFSYRNKRAFVMTLEEAMANYGRQSVHDTPLEWNSCFINKPVKNLEISVTFPEGYTPAYIDKWVWWTETSFLECDYNLADRLLVDSEDGIEIESGERTTVRLRARNPLLGFSYGIVWQPLSKRQFLGLIKS